MSELKGVDQFVARKYKINPQPIKTQENFQQLCKSLAASIASKDFLGRQRETQIQRKAIIKDWHQYITKENRAYTGAIGLMIMGGITAGLRPEEDTLPPILSKGVLADTVADIQTRLNQDEKEQLNFDKEYRLNLQKSMITEEKALDESLNGWIIIPSKEHDSRHFEKNIEKLKVLSHPNWCTKSFNAKPYLSDGDFHIYMENGKPKLGVRFFGYEVDEIQGELNNSRIPVKYGDIAKEHVKNYDLSEFAESEVKFLEIVKAETEEFKSKFKNGIENASAQEIFEALGVTCTKDSDGLLVISHYGKFKDKSFTLSDIGIDEAKLFKEIKAIKGDAYFNGSQLITLGNLESIGRSADFSGSKIQSLGNLKFIGRSAYFRDSQIQDLGNLESIGSEAYFDGSQVQSLGKLKSIGGSATFRFSKIKNLGNLESVGGYAIFDDSQVQNLGNLKTIGGYADFYQSQVRDLGNLESIGGDAYFPDSQVQSLGNLKTIGGDAHIENSLLKPSDFDSIEIYHEIVCE